MEIIKKRRQLVLDAAKKKMKSKAYKVEGVEINDKPKRAVKVESLPAFWDQSLKQNVSSHYLRYNKQEEKLKRRFGQTTNASDNMGDRPLSARSAQTGLTMGTMLTGAQTQFSNKTKEDMKEAEEVMKKMMDKKA